MVPDFEEVQLAGPEQELVLLALAERALRPGARFLEVGSWLGHSTLLLARALEPAGGTLVALDTWEGTPGTRLAAIARAHDVFARFRARIDAAKLSDVVIPCLARAEDVLPTLERDSFDFVFLDGDHRYASIRRDIEHCLPLVRPGGILCGHDCEGFIADFSTDLMEHGLEVDTIESVHAGVIRAVGETFTDYAIDWGIWSASRAEGCQWRRTDLHIDGLERRRQPPPNPFAASRSYQYFRFRHHVYAVPADATNVDPEIGLIPSNAIMGATLAEVSERTGEMPRPFEHPPRLLASRAGYNLVAIDARYVAIAQSLGPTNLCGLAPEEWASLIDQRLARFAGSPAELIDWIDQEIARPSQRRGPPAAE